MSLKDRVQQEMVVAMKAKDQAALRALRAIKSAILLAETAEGRASGPLSPEEEMKLLIKQSKQRKDSIDQFEAAGRNDLAATEAEELVVIGRFLPAALSNEELEAAIRQIIASAGATSIKEMGKVMGLASAKLTGKADGKQIAEMVKKLLG